MLAGEQMSSVAALARDAPEWARAFVDAAERRVRELDDALASARGDVVKLRARAEQFVAENEQLHERLAAELEREPAQPPPAPSSNDRSVIQGPSQERARELAERVDILMAENALMVEQTAVLQAELDRCSTDLDSRPKPSLPCRRAATRGNAAAPPLRRRGSGCTASACPLDGVEATRTSISAPRARRRRVRSSEGHLESRAGRRTWSWTRCSPTRRSTSPGGGRGGDRSRPAAVPAGGGRAGGTGGAAATRPRRRVAWRIRSSTRSKSVRRRACACYRLALAVACLSLSDVVATVRPPRRRRADAVEPPRRRRDVKDETLPRGSERARHVSAAPSPAGCSRRPAAIP